MSEPYWVPLGQAPVSGQTPWATGDTKVSMQAASHADPTGGQWLLADGSAISGAYTALIALIGANLPDAKGRGLVMVGSHADVNAVGKNDGIGIAARRPRHKQTASASFATAAGAATGLVSRVADLPRDSQYSAQAVTVSVGPQTGSEPTDSMAYVVVGNLFVHT